MIRKAVRILNNQKGQSFLESALYIIIVVFVVAGGGYALANSGIKPKLEDLQTSITNVTVPAIK
ncbi:MAG: hypothetical protein ACOX6I_10320 [Syntrophomonadaceae bacterium]|jgi:hypothetical protein